MCLLDSALLQCIVAGDENARREVLKYFSDCVFPERLHYIFDLLHGAPHHTNIYFVNTQASLLANLGCSWVAQGMLVSRHVAFMNGLVALHYEPRSWHALSDRRVLELCLPELASPSWSCCVKDLHPARCCCKDMQSRTLDESCERLSCKRASARVIIAA